jgi:hypothetical protein
MAYHDDYHNSEYYAAPSFLFKTLRFGDWRFSPSSGRTYPVGPNGNQLGLNLRERQNPVSENLCFK